MKYYDEIKKELEENPEKKAEYEKMEVPSFDEYMSKNKHLLNEPDKEKKQRTRRIPRFAAIAAGLILFLSLGLGLGLYFGLNSNTPPIIYRYEDSDIAISDYNEDDFPGLKGLYLPDFDLMTEKFIMVGVHKESHEIVHLSGSVVFDNGVQYQKSIFKIVLQPKYLITDDEEFNTNNKIKINDYYVSVFDSGFDGDLFFRYKLGFKIDDIRYYFEYQSIEENDYISFFEMFLK